MPPRHATDTTNIKEVVGTSLMLTVVPLLVLAITKGLLFASYWRLGMHWTAFTYFRSAVNDYRAFLFVFLAVLLSYFVLTTFLRKKISGKAQAYYAITPVLLGLWMATLFRLDKSPWYPSNLTFTGGCYNLVVTLFFVFAGLIAVKRSPRTGLYSGVAVGLLVLITNGYFALSHLRNPLMFTDVAERVGMRDIRNSLGVAWGDVDNDGWQDLFVSNHLPISTESFLYHNEGGRSFTARAMATGDLHGPAFGDFDRDGDLDLFVAGGNNTPEGPAFANILFRNDRGTFDDVAAGAQVDDPLGRAWGGAWADFNNDGWLDLFVANYFTANALFRNAGNGTFHNVARSAGITESAPGEGDSAGTLSASWADYDADGDMDLLTVGISTGMALYRNNGNGTFTDVAAASGLVTNNYLGWERDPRGLSGCSWGDYDNDGDLDLYIGALRRTANNLLFQNQGNGSFLEVGAAAGVDSFDAARALMWGDFDNDGDLDLYVVNEAVSSINLPHGTIASEQSIGADAWNRLYVNQGNGTFVELSADETGAAGFPYVHEGTGAVVDYDNDGFLDIFVNNQTPLGRHNRYLARNILLRNSGNGNNWLEIRLQGTASNRDGIGSKIYLSAEGKTQFREQDGGSHTFAQSSMIIHFGIGQVRSVDRLVVKWPSGATQTLTKIPANRTLTIVEQS
jgi:hypothetical protein